jgi:hypothetical protein
LKGATFFRPSPMERLVFHCNNKVIHKVPRLGVKLVSFMKLGDKMRNWGHNKPKKNKSQVNRGRGSRGEGRTGKSKNEMSPL